MMRQAKTSTGMAGGSQPFPVGGTPKLGEIPLHNFCFTLN